MEELLDWLEVRISSSLRPRADEIKHLLTDHHYRCFLLEFLKNEDVHALYIYFKLAKSSLAASLSPPPALQNKCICFIKLGATAKLTLDNIANNVITVDCAKLPLKYIDMVLHQVYLPLLCNDNIMAGKALSTDKIIDILHRFMGNLAVMAGHAEGSIVLPFPSTEILNSPPLSNKRGVAIHILETSVIGWIRQIKVVLKHEPLTEIKSQGQKAGIYHEQDMWSRHIYNLQSIIKQLSSAEARDIVSNLQLARSTYGHSITAVKRDVEKALYQAEENATYLKTIIQWYNRLNAAKSPAEKQKTFSPMLHSLFLVWTHSRYYHQSKVFLNLLRLMSNQVMEIAGTLLGRNILDSPQAYSYLKEALKICATFRGTYLDIKAKADEINSKKNAENASQISLKSADTLWKIRMYGPLAPKISGKEWPIARERKENDEEPAAWVDSPWPLHNASCFQNMNMFMERCNDVLDLVETMRHFQVLKTVAAIGGAGTSSSDAMVKDIWETYCSVKDNFVNSITDIFVTDKNSPFEKVFFDFRTSIKSLEHQLGCIIRSSYDQCPTIMSQLRLLEVFEGISRRDVVKDHLKDKDEELISMFIEELTEVNNIYQAMADSPPLHINMTPTVSKLMWIKGLKARIYDPMGKLRQVSPLSLEGDMGWKLRHLHTETTEELERFESNVMNCWLSAINKDLNDAVKMPLLKATDLHHDPNEYLHTIELNLKPGLLVFLREAEYLLKPPFMIKLPETIGSVVSSLDINKLKILSARMEIITSKYNELMKTISYHQMSLFEKKLLKINEILKDGMNFFTWSMDESTDYTELATSYVCTDLYTNFNTVKNNYKVITELTAAWCNANLDIFTCRDFSRSYSISELITKQKELENQLETVLISDGQKMHEFVHQSFVATGLSEASPAWQEYLMHIDTLILQGLKNVTITSLAALLNTLLDSEHVPILCIVVELINSEVAFNPPLDLSTSEGSVMEYIEGWLKVILLRGTYVKGFSNTVKGGYQEYISANEEALQLVGLTLQHVEKCVHDCQAILEVFRDFAYLWKKDISKEFQNFLYGKQTLKSSVDKDFTTDELDSLSKSTTGSSTMYQSRLLEDAERTFTLPKTTTGQIATGPLLEEFDSEISAHKIVRDKIEKLPDFQRCMWIDVDFHPVKQVLTAYSLKWMWTFTKYLIDQTSTHLRSLDFFLKNTEPQIESITGEERDTGSFMKMMRLFNEVSSKQVEMEVQFTVLQKTVTLIEKHDAVLPAESEVLFRTMPSRWNSLKTKVSLAKQRLGPRIQQEAEGVTKDLEQFQHKLDILGVEIENSEVFMYNCTSQKAFMVVDNFTSEIQILKNEAKDLTELQELLETTVVDFSILQSCEDLLRNLRIVWQQVDSILKEQDIWKNELWQNLDTKELMKRTSHQLKVLQALPEEVQGWNIYIKALEAVNVIHLTLPLIEDLNNPAMRTRHWNQLVRHTGGVLRVTAESLKAMTLGDLLVLDLQEHTGTVRTTVQRAMRDVTIESALTNCEEVWLSRIFDLHPHCRVIAARAHNEEVASSISGSHQTKADYGRHFTASRSSRRLSRQSDKALHVIKKGNKGSTMSLYESLKYIEEFGTVMLLSSTNSIFEELEHHQLVLSSMQPYAEAGAFLDEVTKWQKKLQAIEIIVQQWILVQEKWTQLEEVFSTLAFRISMPREAALFADVHHNFCRLMKAVEENPNILQNCMRRGLQSMLDQLNYKLERCQKAVRLHLEQKRMAFPRFFFLSLEDTLNIVCYGYDLGIVSGYMEKLFQHVHSLIYHLNDSDHDCHKILGVRSCLGEELYLREPLECKGPVESWLPQLVNSIKASLQHHLWAALEHTESGVQRRREIHSAGARRVVINRAASQGESTADRSIPVNVEKSSLLPLTRHFILKTLNDVGYLSTQINFSWDLKQIINLGTDSCKEKLQGCLKDLTEGIEYAAKILNEIPQEVIQQHSERTSKAEREGNGQGNLDEGLLSGCVHENDEDSRRAPNADQQIYKTSLSAGDAVKLTNHILVLLYQRDVTEELLSKTAPIWSQPLCYEHDGNTLEINVKIGDSDIIYGYEYQGLAEHQLITPLTERTFLSIITAVSYGMSALCIDTEGTEKGSTVRELCLALGKPLFCFNCTQSTDFRILRDIGKGLAAAGAWICLNGLEQLTQSNLTNLAHLLAQIQYARHCGKESVTLHMDEVSLNTSGACIAIIKRMPNDALNWNIYPTSCKLPNTLLNCFRIIGVTCVPVNYFLEAKLLLNGFSHVPFLAQKLSALFDSLAKLCKPSLAPYGSPVTEMLACSSIFDLTYLLEEAKYILQSLQRNHVDKHEKELGGEHQNWQLVLEDRAIIAAVHLCWLPQLSAEKAQVFQAILAAEWPNTLISTNNSNLLNSMDGLIPAVIAEKYGPGQQVPSSESIEETSIPSAIIKAAEKCHIFPSNTFVSKVSHLVQLAPKYQTVVVTGPPGCGKTKCIETYVETLKLEGKKVSMNMVFIKALQTEHLLGFINEEWVDGLLPQLLRKYCQKSTTDDNKVDILQLDGEVDNHQMEIMQNLFCGSDVFITEINERIRISESLQVFWELDTLADVSPAILCCMGIFSMTYNYQDWKLPLKIWIKSQAEERQQLLYQLVEMFLEPSLQFLMGKQIIYQQGDENYSSQRGMFLTEATVVHTFCKLYKALIQHMSEEVTEDIKKCFMFTCIWSFGGWLDSQEKSIFNNWWRQALRNHITFPTEGEVWDYHIDNETRQFVRWQDMLSSYSPNPGQGIASDAFVHTVHNEQLLFLSSLLTMSGSHVMLVGNAGCGKTSIMQELLSSLSTGDVTELLEVRIPINSSTDPRKFWDCLKEKLEWRHGTLHTPTGNKKLLCLLDDLNLAKVDEYGNRSACEFVRQLVDQERLFDTASLKWKTIRDITYVGTWNFNARERYPSRCQRLLRHFCVFYCQYPSQRDQRGIFTTILNAHFLQQLPEYKAGTLTAAATDQLQEFLTSIASVSIELQERLRTIFLRTSQRCHYIFTLRDLNKVFRNICLSLDGSTTAEKLLCLWRHECDWVYGHKMSSSVDYSRYQLEFAIAAKKAFANERELQIILSQQQPLFSNVVEDDGGLITTVAKQQDIKNYKRSEKMNSAVHILDGYQQTFNLVHVKQLLTEALREYNKSNPRMNITFYKDTIELLCRLTRNLGSFYGSSHTMLCGGGCPRSSCLLARLAAHLSAFSVVHIGSHDKTQTEDQRVRRFKSQLVDCYVKAGLKGQRIMILLSEEEIDSTVLVHMTEFVVFGSVSHLFTPEQQATIANAMRSEVTNVGLTYSKESAWNLFLQSVQQNTRWFLIYSNSDSTFYNWCLEFSSLINTINVYFIPHWSREDLVEHASYHIHDLAMLTPQDTENICHLLASMHLSVIKHERSTQDGYANITNATFEKFAECFRALIKDQYAIIVADHQMAKAQFDHITEKLKQHTNLTDDLKHQMVVLEENKEGALQILHQIAQDKAMAEQKIQTVYQQLQKIKKFRTLLPEYQLALEKSQYKCSAILADIKDLVQNMDIRALGELRAMQKPDVDLEELMASIIIILKSPNNDLTWAKGAKRQMANIDRFLNELIGFSNTELSQSTLELLETNIKKTQFTSENMERKSGGNIAAASLLRWLQGAVRYYRLLSSKVKPLQKKVEGISLALEEAEQKMASLQQKKKSLIIRLSDLEKAFEEATVHKNEQQHRTIEISQKLDQAATITKLLEKEKEKYAAIVNSFQDRLSGMPGTTAIAAGLVSYLGTYEHMFRQFMLTVEWPMALKERGFPLMVDSIDPVRGRTVEFSVIFTCESPRENEKVDQKQEFEVANGEIINGYSGQEETILPSSLLPNQFAPIVTEELYEDYIMALLMRIVRQDVIQMWAAKDWTPQQMENAAILVFAWQCPLLLIDPFFEGEKWVQDILQVPYGNVFSSINLQARQDSSVLAPIEKTFVSGYPLILHNYSNKWDDLLMPLIDHCSANVDGSSNQDSFSIISFNGHRVLCSDQFRLYLAASEVEPHLNVDISSGSTILNYSPSEESLLELLLRKAFAKLQPDLYCKLMTTAATILEHQQSLTQLQRRAKDYFMSLPLTNEVDTFTIITLFNEQNKVSKELKKAKSQYSQLIQERNKLYPLAQRGALFYSILKSLRALAVDYYFSLDAFLKIFYSVLETQKYLNQVEDKNFREGSDATNPAPADEDSGTKTTVNVLDEETFDKQDTLPASEGQELNSSAGEQFFTLTSSQISKLMDQLTHAVYQTIIQSLLPEHSVQACALFFFCMQQQENENAFTDKEFDFFAQGSFVLDKLMNKWNEIGTNISAPTWLPQETWEDVLALSVTPGPLRHFCLQIVENSAVWEEWYNSFSGRFGYEVTDKEAVAHLPNCCDPRLSDFHQLLVLRALLPNQFPIVLSRHVRRLSRNLGLDNSFQSLYEIAKIEENLLGVVVIMPSTNSKQSYGGTVFSHEPILAICNAAKEKAIHLSIVSMKNGNEDHVKSALNDTMNQNGWLIIENIQLVPKSVLKNLHKSLMYAMKMRDSQMEGRQFCVWLMSEPGAHIPNCFLAQLKRVSWHYFLSHDISRRLLLKEVEYIDSFPGLLSSAIGTALDHVEEATLVKLKEESITVRATCFGICVLHGILQTLKLFPNTGLNDLIAMGPIQLNQAIDIAVSAYDKMKNPRDFSDAVKEGVNGVYGSLTVCSEHTAYIQALVHEIICSSLEQKGLLTIGHLTIPIPPDNMEPTKYSRWLSDNMLAKYSAEDLLLPRAIEEAASRTYATEFMLSLSTVYNSMKRSFFTPDSNYTTNNLTQLRASIDIISEQLPPLIQIDEVQASVYEPITSNQGITRELQTSKHVLLQECNWINTFLKDIKHSVEELSQFLIVGLPAIPERYLREIAEALQKSEVPQSWLYPHRQHPASHSLLSWLQDLHKKHKQLKQWVKKGLMPFAKSEKEAMTSIYLGGLNNPEALLIALRVEFAVHHGYTLHEVVLQCHIAEYPDYKPDTEGYQLYLESLILQGAEWDFKNNHLKKSRNIVQNLPFVIITPAFFGNVKPTEDGTEIYECPVYIDSTMQCFVMKLPLLCTKPIQQWHLRRVAIILNQDLNANNFGITTASEMEEQQRNFQIKNILTQMDITSHITIPNGTNEKNNSVLEIPNKDISIDAQTFTSENALTDKLLLDSDQGSILQDFHDEMIVENTDAAFSPLFNDNMIPNQENEEIVREKKTSTHDKISLFGNQALEVKNEEVIEGNNFIETERSADGGEEQKTLRKSSTVYTRTSEYAYTNNVNGHGHNNETDIDSHISSDEDLQGVNDYEAGENQASSNYEWNVEDSNVQDFDYNNDSKYASVGDENKDNTKRHSSNS
ncbi:uncharacterized protein LOC128652486 [Bombina bombina]|uniref:uncharacterized protein LOC128652486 n=1 Tax=Bombina bombina TaxID=8345 RepID=UPI00235A9431|nr:uncharacterized protein LOC128652486 [Bombina bombina]